jgi:hypothetical protein
LVTWLTAWRTFVDAGAQASAQQQFASVQDVVAGLPELSVLLQLLNTQLKGTSIPKWLQDPSFNGTVFASVNAVRTTGLDGASKCLVPSVWD